MDRVGFCSSFSRLSFRFPFRALGKLGVAVSANFQLRARQAAAHSSAILTAKRTNDDCEFRGKKKRRRCCKQSQKQLKRSGGQADAWALLFPRLCQGSGGERGSLLMECFSANSYQVPAFRDSQLEELFVRLFRRLASAGNSLVPFSLFFFPLFLYVLTKSLYIAGC